MVEARRRTLRISPLSHPEERPGPARERPSQGTGTSRPGRWHPLPAVRVGARFASSHPTTPRDPGAKRGGTAEASAFVPARGDCIRLSAVSSSCDPISLEVSTTRRRTCARGGRVIAPVRPSSAASPSRQGRAWHAAEQRPHEGWPLQGTAPQPAQGRRAHRRGDRAAARRRHQLDERDHSRPPACSTRSPTP